MNPEHMRDVLLRAAALLLVVVGAGSLRLRPATEVATADTTT